MLVSVLFLTFIGFQCFIRHIEFSRHFQQIQHLKTLYKRLTLKSKNKSKRHCFYFIKSLKSLHMLFHLEFETTDPLGTIFGQKYSWGKPRQCWLESAEHNGALSSLSTLLSMILQGHGVTNQTIYKLTCQFWTRFFGLKFVLSPNPSMVRKLTRWSLSRSLLGKRHCNFIIEMTLKNDSNYY